MWTTLLTIDLDSTTDETLTSHLRLNRSRGRFREEKNIGHWKKLCKFIINLSINHKHNWYSLTVLTYPSKLVYSWTKMFEPNFLLECLLSNLFAIREVLMTTPTLTYWIALAFTMLLFHTPPSKTTNLNVFNYPIPNGLVLDIYFVGAIMSVVWLYSVCMNKYNLRPKELPFLYRFRTSIIQGDQVRCQK